METAGTQVSAKATYERMRTDRDTYLKRGRSCALLTIPSLIPDQEDQEDKDRSDPYPHQSLGARGTNNLAAKLLLTLFPPNSPFFRFMLSDKIEAEMAGVEPGSQEVEDLRLEFEKALQKAEASVQKDFESSSTRPSLFEFFKHLIVGGNSAIQDQGIDGIRVFGLHQYVVRRSPQGRVMEAVIHEKVDKRSLPEGHGGLTSEPAQGEKDPDMYTHIMWNGTKWDVYQESMDIEIPGSRGSYTSENMPFIFARMVKVDGADYGRSYVEEHYGDLFSLEKLSQSSIEIAQIMARLLVLVNPNGNTDETDVQEANNGDIITGDPNDLHLFQPELRSNLQGVNEKIGSLEQNISSSFLLQSSVQRNAERVTAEEIRYMASELEQALGGVYTILSQEVMLPLVKIRIASLRKRKSFPALPKDSVDLKIIVGVEALGRGHDLNRLRGWIADVGNAAKVLPKIIDRVKEDDILARLTAAHGLTNVDLIITEQEAAEAATTEQQNALVQNAAPGVAKELAKGTMSNDNQS